MGGKGTKFFFSYSLKSALSLNIRRMLPYAKEIKKRNTDSTWYTDYDLANCTFWALWYQYISI